MSTKTGEGPVVNGTYEPKFLHKVISIPVISSIKKQVFIYIPQAEVLTKYVGSQLSTAFGYTDDTALQGALIRLDSLAASGAEKLEKQVPIVNASTEEILKKTKVDRFLSFFTHYYTVAMDYLLRYFDSYKGIFDRLRSSLLDRIESFFGMRTMPEEQKRTPERIKRIPDAMVDRLSSQIARTKDTFTQLTTIVQYPIHYANGIKEKANEMFSPVLSAVNTRFTKAESAATDAWNQTKPKNHGPDAIIPTIKSLLFAGFAFGYSLLYPSEQSNSEVDGQVNGLVSGVDLNDGQTAKKRGNEKTS